MEYDENEHRIPGEMGHGTLVPSEPQVIAGIYGCSSHKNW